MRRKTTTIEGDVFCTEEKRRVGEKFRYSLLFSDTDEKFSRAFFSKTKTECSGLKSEKETHKNKQNKQRQMHQFQLEKNEDELRVVLHRRRRRRRDETRRGVLRNISSQLTENSLECDWTFEREDWEKQMHGHLFSSSSLHSYDAVATVCCCCCCCC